MQEFVVVVVVALLVGGLQVTVAVGRQGRVGQVGRAVFSAMADEVEPSLELPIALRTLEFHLVVA